MVSRTREKLIEVARQLFIHKGVENTTISDIANASDKGRRTIYTYFRNKREIYNAVIDRESDKLVEEMRDNLNSKATPADKLREFFNLRLSRSNTTTTPYSTIKSLISPDFRRTERIRKMAYAKEEAILDEILEEGIADGSFRADRCAMFRGFRLKLLQGLDIASLNPDNAPSDQVFASSLTQFIVSALKTED